MVAAPELQHQIHRKEERMFPEIKKFNQILLFVTDYVKRILKTLQDSAFPGKREQSLIVK